jgi:flagellar basal body-associated protein FliL
MAETAQVKKLNPVVKYLLVMIAIVFSMLFVSVLSIYTYYHLATGERVAGQEADSDDLNVESYYRFEHEFLASSADEKNGIIRFKLELALNDKEGLTQFLRNSNAKIRDMIQRKVMGLKVAEAKKLYTDGQLHKEIMRDINDFIVSHKPSRMTLLGTVKRLRVVEVNFEDFFASLVE